MAVSDELKSLNSIMTAAAAAVGGGCLVGGLGDELVEAIHLIGRQRGDTLAAWVAHR